MEEFKPRDHACKSKESNILFDEIGIPEQGREYFRKLLNRKNGTDLNYIPYHTVKLNIERPSEDDVKEVIDSAISKNSL